MTGGTHPGGPSDPLIGRTVLGRYRLGRRLGAGGMGAVYEAEQLAVGRAVAVKVLRSDLTSHGQVRDRFRREAEVIGRLRHPHTIQLIDFGETDDGLVVMVTELLLGQPLDALLTETGGLSLVETLLLGEQVAGSLVEAHALGLVHRDLKPANVFVTRVSGEPFAKVLDFGIARVMDEGATKLTSTGQIFGTPRYMSPEQAASTTTVDGRSDLYSLGLILFECAAGAPPFRATTAIQYLAAHSTQVPPRLRELRPDAPADLEALVVQLLAKSPDERPQTAEHVRQSLAALRARLRGGSTQAEFQPASAPSAGISAAPTRRAGAPEVPAEAYADTARPSPPPVRARRGPPYAALAAVAVGLGVGLGAWALATRGGRPSGITAAPVAAAEAALDAGPTARPQADREEAAQPGLDAATPDAGAASEVRDVGPRRTGEAPEKRRPRRRPRQKKSPGIVSGPRGLELDVTEPVVDLTELASGCDRSEWSGLSSLSTRGCPAHCAILIDAMCAGRTPAEARAVAPGPRTVVIVCSGKPYRKRKVTFRAGQTTTIDCR
jgi:serine/threonine-protein kinase